MSECSAVVRLQVVHPVPAFFIFSKICIPRWLYGFMLVYFENCEWHIRALFEGEQRVEESQLKCEGVGQTKVSVSYHAVAEDWGEMADSEINVLDKYIEKEALHAMMAVLTKKQRNLIYQNYVLDKTHQEIADGMGIARGSVTRSVNQALERIRRKFDFEAHYELAVGDFT